MTTIRIPTPLRPYTGGQAEIPVSGETVGAALTDLTTRHPALQKHLYTEAGELRAFVNIFLNEEDIRHGRGVESPLQEKDRLMIVPSIAGGAEVPVTGVVLQADQTLDCSGLACPMPIIKLSKAFKELPVGNMLKVIATDSGSASDIPAWAKQTGNELLDARKEGDTFVFHLKRVK